jgi:hypothetical protein
MDDRSLEESTKKRTGSGSLLKRKLYRPGPLVFIFCLAIAGILAVGYYLATEKTPPPPVVTAAGPEKKEARVYEEDTSSTMEDMVKQADLAIIETMRDLNLDMAKLDLLDVEIRKSDAGDYHYQVLQIPPLPDRNNFLSILKKHLSRRSPESLLAQNGSAEATLSVAALPTHRLLLNTVPFVLPRPETKGPKLAIVIDDIGEDMKVLTGLVNLKFPVTLAVWPNASHTREAVELVLEKQHDLIIHFPMEPMGYPKYNPGEDALFVSMNSDEIKKRIEENVSKIPEAIGVNNHMGSRFTGDEPRMVTALGEFKRHGLFFLDSLTTPRSAARKAATRTAIAYYERDIFLDNVKDVNAIIHQLKKAENVARKQGHAIAIGHPYPQTLAALRQWGKSRRKGIRVIPISAMSPEKAQ